MLSINNMLFIPHCIPVDLFYITPNFNIYSFQSQLARKGLRYLMWMWDVSVCWSRRGMKNCVGHLEQQRPWTSISPRWWLQIISLVGWFALISTVNQHNLPAAWLHSKPSHDGCKKQEHKGQWKTRAPEMGVLIQILPMTLHKNISSPQTEQNSKWHAVRVKLYNCPVPCTNWLSEELNRKLKEQYEDAEWVISGPLVPTGVSQTRGSVTVSTSLLFSITSYSDDEQSREIMSNSRERLYS